MTLNQSNTTPEAVAGIEERQANEHLTAREIEVLRLVTDGNTTKEIAACLKISFKTAACHRYRIMSKLGIHSSALLVRHAIREGFIQP